MDWDKLRVFHAVAEAGSFTHAGEALNLSQSAVSRQVSSLEEDLGVQLFHRHARGLILTEQGEILSDTANDVTEQLQLVQAAIADSKEKPTGELRVTSTVGFGSTWLTPRIHEFLHAYPEIRLSIICDDRELDLGMREADVAIRITEPTQPDLVKKRLFTVHTHVYAAPEYLERHGEPRTVGELDEHAIIAYVACSQDRAQQDLAAALAVLKHGDRVLVHRDVATDAAGTRRHDAGQRAGELNPACFGSDLVQRADKVSKVADRIGRLVGEFLELLSLQSDLTKIVSGGHQGGEPLGVTVTQRRDELGRQFLRRDRTPTVDHPVLVVVDPPPRSCGTEPAILIRFAVEVGIDIAIDLNAVAEVAPQIDLLVVVGVSKSPQHRPVGCGHSPA